MKPAAISTSDATAVASIGVDHPVLVATSVRDGLTAMRAAQLVASHTGADVVALSVVEPELTALYDSEYGYLSPEYESKRVEDRLRAVRRQVERVTGTIERWDTVVRIGEADRAISDEARHRRAGLIVMDTGRHSMVARLLVGERTLRTIRWAHCPVLAIGKTFDALPRVAVAAIDFSPSSIAAARSALAVLDEHATLYLVHVWRRSLSDHPSERERDYAYEATLDGLFGRVLSVLGAPSGISVRPMTILGEPVEELLGFAASQGADLIVAGRRGHGFFERLLIGSVTSALVRGADCGVLVTPEPPLAEDDRLSRLVTGVFETRKASDWPAELDGFSRRNRGRETMLEVDDPAVGRRMQARGYVLLGAAFDRKDRRAELMLGDPAVTTAHLTHTMPNVSLVAVRSAPSGKDEALLIAHGAGWATLRFPPEHAEARAETKARPARR